MMQCDPLTDKQWQARAVIKANVEQRVGFNVYTHSPHVVWWGYCITSVKTKYLCTYLLY